MFTPVSSATISELLASFRAFSPVDSKYVLKFKITIGVSLILFMITLQKSKYSLNVISVSWI